MSRVTSKASLRENVLSSIGDFLYGEGFKNDEMTKFGILEIINLISDYHEEGTPLYPEVVITNDMSFFKTIPNKELVIHESDLSVEQFKNAIKLCAPLANNSWIIFIEVRNNRIRYGLTSAEMTETSPSIYNQTVGALKVEPSGITLAYIRNIGQKTVELIGLKKRIIVSLTLDEPKEISFAEIKTLSEQISSKCDETYRINIQTFFEKIIDEALKDGHGSLIAVIDDSVEAILKLKNESKDGLYLPEPIDFQNLLREAEINKTNETSINLKSHTSILKSMIKHDGITVISNKGRLIGYHLYIKLKSEVKTAKKKNKDAIQSPKKQVTAEGGRSRAFVAMEDSKIFTFCFLKSHDGIIKIWSENE